MTEIILDKKLKKQDKNKSVLQQAVTRDSGKRGRLVFLAALISLSLFVMQALNLWEVTSRTDLLIKALSFGFFTFLTLIWSFRFTINWRSIMVVIPQSVIFVMAFVLFVEMFFFRRLERAMDFFVLFVIWGGSFLSLYISFLMTNIFNVSMFKDIPLKQVAKTTSYILSMVLVYLYSFSFLAMQLNFVVTAVFLLLVYAVIIFTHFYHLNFSLKNLINAVVVVIVGMLASVLAFMFVSSRHELVALMPTVAAFSMIGITMHKSRAEGVSRVSQFEYFFVYFAVVVLNIFLG